MLSIAPRHILNHFAREVLADGRTLVNGLSMLANWWKNSVGLKLRRDLANGGIGRTSSLHWKCTVSERQAYEDDYVVLFCALCRAIGLHARLVASLRPIPIAAPSAGEAASDSFVFVPDNWVEILHPVERKWIPVDCTRAIVNCQKSMEAGGKGRQAMVSHLFVVAADEAGSLIDVTRRYSSKYYGATWKARTADEAALGRFLVAAARGSPGIGSDEDAELEAFTEAEALPESATGYQMHGKYVLEGKVRKYETLHPGNEPVGTFRGESVHLRRNLRKVRSKEAWYTQFARSLQPGAAPVKVIQLPRKKKRGFVEPDEDAYEPGAMQPLYGEWQTEPYVPHVAVDGKVPRNAHGNVDLFQPEMLPVGCAYIPYTGVWRVARELEVDYADACVRFAFHGRMAVPNLQGIVVCKEHEAKVLARYFRKVEEDLQADSEEVARQELLRRRRKALSVKIATRLTEEYAEEGAEEEAAQIQSAFSRSNDNSDADDFTFD